MRKYLVLLVTTILSNMLYAQQEVKAHIDSLLIELQQAAEDTGKVILLNELTTAYWEKGILNSADTISSYAKEAIQLAQKLGYKEGLATAFLNKGKFEIAHSHRFAVATTDLLESLYNFEKLNDSAGISKCYLQMGVVSFILMYYEDAIKNLEQSILFAADNPGIKATGTYLTALSYSELKNIEAAKKYFSQALQSYSQLGNRNGIMECYIYMGKMYANSELPDSGFYYLNKSIAMIDSSGDSSAWGRPFSFLSSAMLKKGNVNEAIRYGLSAYHIGRDYRDEITVIESVNTLNKAYFLKGDFSKAYFFLKELKEMKDSIFNSSVAQRVAESKSKFIFEKELNDRKLEQEKEEAIAQAQIQKQIILQYAFIIGIILLVVLILVILNRSRLKERSARELTEAYANLKTTQQQLIQQEKLASLGALTAGIAHEIKNPLNFVNNFSDLSIELISDLTPATPEEERNEILADVKKNLEKISQHGKRADGIVKSMLQHSRTGLDDRIITDINKLCDEFIDLAFHGMRAKSPELSCQVVKSYASVLPRINVIPSDISRVILNLTGNAFYAVQKKADLLNGEAKSNYKAKVGISTFLQSRKIVITISDNGIGIPEEIKEKIFEPFFTTKPTGEGTGLGLSICFDIIKAHGGEIKVESKEQEFTEFVIMMPV